MNGVTNNPARQKMKNWLDGEAAIWVPDNGAVVSIGTRLP